MSTDSSSDDSSEYAASTEIEEMDVPDELRLRIGSAGISTLKFHPNDANLIALGTTDGRVRLYRIEHQRVTCVSRLRSFGSVRKLVFASPTKGSRVVSCSAAGGIKVHDSNTAQLVRFYRRAHRVGIGGLAALDEERFVCADDDNQLSLWDIRQPDAVFRLDLKNEESSGDTAEDAKRQQKTTDDKFSISGITDCVVDAQGYYIYCSSADGTVCTVNLRRRRLELRSEFFGAGLSSALLAKSGRKLVIGSEDGYLNILDTKDLQTANISDRLPVLKRVGKSLPSVECLTGPLGIAEDMLLAGCSDGMVRAIRVLPHRWLDVVGQVDNHRVIAGDCMTCAVDSEQSLLAVSCPDSAVVRFWAVSQFVNLANKEAEGQDLNEKEAVQAGKKVNPNNKVPRFDHRKDKLGAASFFADIC